MRRPFDCAQSYNVRTVSLFYFALPGMWWAGSMAGKFAASLSKEVCMQKSAARTGFSLLTSAILMVGAGNACTVQEPEAVRISSHALSSDGF